MTHPTPTKPGFYWARVLDDAPEIVHVWMRQDDKLRVDRPGYSSTRALGAFIWLSSPLSPDDSERLASLEAENARLREALDRIAAWDDTGAGELLTACGSYSAFDEPGSVEIARKVLGASLKAKASMMREGS